MTIENRFNDSKISNININPKILGLAKWGPLLWFLGSSLAALIVPPLLTEPANQETALWWLALGGFFLLALASLGLCLCVVSRTIVSGLLKGWSLGKIIRQGDGYTETVVTPTFIAILSLSGLYLFDGAALFAFLFCWTLVVSGGFLSGLNGAIKPLNSATTDWIISGFATCGLAFAFVLLGVYLFS